MGQWPRSLEEVDVLHNWVWEQLQLALLPTTTFFVFAHKWDSSSTLAKGPLTHMPYKMKKKKKNKK
jgi:hypothetical protein